MTFLSRIAAWLQRFDRQTWPDHRIVISPPMAALLAREKLVIADVGAAAGPEARWLELSDYIHFLTFEPVERPNEPSPPYARTNFSIGLYSERKTGLLHLMKDLDASTLCEVNHEMVSDFVVADGLQATGTLPLELDTLDHCLAGKPHLSPHFLKIDVEGADLEVLKGAAGALTSSVLAIRIETSFLERHKGAPFFGDTDAFLRERGFQLFQLSRELWIRRNQLHGYSSQPQLAWGDAVYFLSRQPFLDRLMPLSPPARAALTTRFVVILLAYGAHDYAAELVQAAALQNLLTAEEASILQQAIKQSVDDCPLYLLKSFGGVVFASAIWIASLPLAEARRRGRFYFKQRARRFFYLLWRLNSRGGPHDSCISE